MRQGFLTSDKWNSSTPILERMRRNTGNVPIHSWGCLSNCTGKGQGTQRQHMISLSGGNSMKFKVQSKKWESCALKALKFCRVVPSEHWLCVCEWKLPEDREEILELSRQKHSQNPLMSESGLVLFSQVRVEGRFHNTWDKTAVTKILYLSKNVEKNMILMGGGQWTTTITQRDLLEMKNTISKFKPFWTLLIQSMQTLFSSIKGGKAPWESGWCYGWGRKCTFWVPEVRKCKEKLHWFGGEEFVKGTREPTKRVPSG